jgi:hypothetical protein
VIARLDRLSTSRTFSLDGCPVRPGTEVAIVIEVPDAPATPGAILYELELSGGVRVRSTLMEPSQRSSRFLVAALWPEAAALAGRQLFIDEAARDGLVVQPDVRVKCTPLQR